MIYADRLVEDHGDAAAALDPLVFDIAGERYVFPAVPDSLVVAALRVYAASVDAAMGVGRRTPLSDFLLTGLFGPERAHLVDAVRAGAMTDEAFKRLGSTLASFYVNGPEAAALAWGDVPATPVLAGRVRQPPS